MDWLLDHTGLLSALASLGTLAIWLLYLQLFYQGYRRQRRPHLLVHQAGGFDLDGLCLIANMSESAVHVAVVLVDAERGGSRVTFQPGPDAPVSPDDDDPLRRLLQGPLEQGGYLLVGTFRDLLREADHRLPQEAAHEGLPRAEAHEGLPRAEAHEGLPRAEAHEGLPRAGAREGSEEGTDITVRIVAFVGANLEPSGTQRRFLVRERGGRDDVRPASLLPEQLSSRRQRRVVRRWLEEAQRLEPRDIAAPDEDAERIRRALRERS